MNFDKQEVGLFKRVVEDIIDARIEKKGITNYVAAIVDSVNVSGSINVFIPPDETKIVKGLLNKTGEKLLKGDSVELTTKNGRLSNAWVSVKHGTNNSGGGSGGTSDYNKLENRPYLSTNADTAFTPQAQELIANTISLHKVSKTGGYPDLRNKPILNTTLTTALPVNNAEIINGTLQLHKISKTGNYNDLLNKLQNLSELNNDSGFITNAVNNLVNYYTKSQTYTKTEVNDLIGAINQLKLEVVETLPTENISTTTIYLVPNGGTGSDTYDEFVYVNNKWEKIGNTQVDLSAYVTKTFLNTTLLNYVTTSSLNTELAKKQDKLVSGTNIKTINGNTLLGSGDITITGAGHIITKNDNSAMPTQPKLKFNGANLVNDTTNTATEVQNVHFRELNQDVLKPDIIAGDMLPVGSIIPFGGTYDNIEDGYLACDGKTYNIVDQQDLFNVIGHLWDGATPGVTTFKVPNMQGYVPVGLNTVDVDFNTVGKVAGSKTHRHIGDNVYGVMGSQAYIGITNDSGTVPGISSQHFFGAAVDIQDKTVTGAASYYTQYASSVQPSAVVAYIIKAKKKPILTSTTVEDTLTSTSTTNALSANMGKVLKSNITTVSNDLETTNSGIDKMKSIIMVKQSALIDWPANTVPTFFPFFTKAVQYGTGLSASSDGHITIGAGVKRVKVTAHIQHNETGIAGKWLMGYIRKNSQGIIRSITDLSPWSSLHADAIIDVVQGDVIDFAVASDASGSVIFPVYDTFAYGNVGISCLIVEAVG